MAEPTKSLFQRLMERRQAIEAGDPTGASSAANAGAVRDALGAPQPPAPKPAAPGPRKMQSKAASALTQRAGESSSSFRLRQINAAADAGEL